MKYLKNGLFWHFVFREIRTAYLENISGFALLVLQPLLLLWVYAFVFTTIFKSRIPDLDIGFVPYLAVAFWPWTAFSEAILKASGAITGNAPLIGKVSLATEQLPLATVTATFIMHMIGYLAVLIVVQILGTQIQWQMLPLLVVLLCLMWVFACSLALIVSALQVFIKDIAQILPPLMTFWFFTTPILYSQAQLPPQISRIMDWNPMTWFVSQLRELLLFGRIDVGIHSGLVVLGIIIFAWLALRFFQRFSDHFEDFL